MLELWLEVIAAFALLCIPALIPVVWHIMCCIESKENAKRRDREFIEGLKQKDLTPEEIQEILKHKTPYCIAARKHKTPVWNGVDTDWL